MHSSSARPLRQGETDGGQEGSEGEGERRKKSGFTARTAIAGDPILCPPDQSFGYALSSPGLLNIFAGVTILGRIGI